MHVPLSQVRVPQQSELFAHGVPADWQRPSVQTLFVLHVRTPQQSPLVLHVLLSVWQDPVSGPPGILLTSTPPLPQAASAKRPPSKRTRAKRTRSITAISLSRPEIQFKTEYRGESERVGFGSMP